MAKRTVALYKDKYIGIETIYTVIDGKQINIPEKLRELRDKSHNDELFCPCGCGTNLILVAGDKNLREQHFRAKIGTGKSDCLMPTESETSIDSKIVLKCWLDDKLNSKDIESRVPIDTVDSITRKVEFTFFSKSNRLAIRYWRTRSNILEDNLDVLDNLSGIHVIYIVDGSNGNTNEQYPEALMKIQKKQGYCLLLDIEGLDYSKAVIRAIFYERDFNGLWQEIEFLSNKLSAIEIKDNQMFMNDISVISLLEKRKKEFFDRQHLEEERRLALKIKLEEQRRQMLEQQEKNRLEKERQREESERKAREIEEYERIKAEELEKEKQRRDADFKKNLESNFQQQDTQVRDAEDNRWIKCEICGKIAKESEFISYGGSGHMNLGKCKECSKNKRITKDEIINEYITKRDQYDTTICPKCGGKLRICNGKYGKFYGCSNYPKCDFTKPLKNKA